MKVYMKKPTNEFVSNEDHKRYKFKIGRHVASSLAGFVAGSIVVSIIWAVFYYFLLIG